jgi:hypothetical protein
MCRKNRQSQEKFGNPHHGEKVPHLGRRPAVAREHAGSALGNREILRRRSGRAERGEEQRIRPHIRVCTTRRLQNLDFNMQTDVKTVYTTLRRISRL